MARDRLPMLGVGIYGVSEASRLTGVSTGRIRRWLEGYSYRYGGGVRQQPAVWAPQLPSIDGRVALGFLDLIEIRFVDAFRRHGVSWPTLRVAAQRARDRLGSSHPFSTRRFKTDGRRILTEVKNDTREASLVDIVSSQLAFTQILAPYLRGLEFGDSDVALRWWPMGQSRQVVIDPKRSFGQPIVPREGVPTVVLARAVRAEGSADAVAAWYDVGRRAVRDAVEFEKQLAA